MDPESFRILEVQKYTMDLEESNRHPERPAVWRLAHNLTSHYGIAAVSPREIDALRERIERYNATYEKFCHTFSSGGKEKANEMLALGAGFAESLLVIVGQRYYGCLMKSRTHSEFAKCVDYSFCMNWDDENEMGSEL